MSAARTAWRSLRETPAIRDAFLCALPLALDVTAKEIADQLRVAFKRQGWIN